ncbi:hypothetical protein RvY_07049 [Ramazzottius varieornatus]|uniref:HAT C-terminal dimerisation domain-containing protein n=1 Tax=Ramazzottius varieornatus TaxID=947166 RepID=A0A1D1V3G5_RAMVA|nr:hypothetical protein RvY_07049 [Ramazzottius varieornatus]
MSKKDWNVKSVICPACNKPVRACPDGMKKHVKTALHKNNVEKRTMVLHERPENMPVRTRIQKLQRLWFRSLAATGVPILAGGKFRQFLRTFVEGGAAIRQRLQLMTVGIPEIKQAEEKRIMGKVRGKTFSIEVDSSPDAQRHFFAVLLIPENSGKGELLRLEFPKSVTGKTTAETVKSIMLKYGQEAAVDHIGDNLEAELTKCGSNSIPYAPYVLEATAIISSIVEGLRLDNELDPRAPAEARTTGSISKPWYTESRTQLVSALTAAKAKEHPESEFLIEVSIFEPSQAVRMMEDRECVRMRNTTLAKWGVAGISQVPIAEWTAYQKIAEEVMFINAGNLDAFWKSHSKDLPILHAVALPNIWTPLNSVEVERCFSVINSFFGKTGLTFV